MKRKLQKLFMIASLFGAMSCAENAGDDPFGEINRPVHKFNVAMDTVLLRPVSQGYGKIVDEEVQVKIANVGSNLGEPKNAINHALQGRAKPAMVNMSRFVLNSTLGAAGLSDPAAKMGLMPAWTNFDQTLATWGAPEGPYVELPILGPNTARSVAGLVVDQVTNPWPRVLNASQLEKYNYFILLSRINDRTRYGSAIDLVLYQSADSYVASRSSYLQAQRGWLEETRSLGAPKGQVDETVELENFYE